MKGKSIITVLALALMIAASQASVGAQSIPEQWRYAFSPEGRQSWKPEFTARGYVGIYTSGVSLTGGVRVDNKRTLGFMFSRAAIYYDYAPADAYRMLGGLYMRRYFHLGPKETVSFYSDVTVGAGYTYRLIDSANRCDSESVGDLCFIAAWQPGIRFRFVGNAHIFLGPIISNYSLGLHLGIGF